MDKENSNMYLALFKFRVKEENEEKYFARKMQEVFVQ